MARDGMSNLIALVRQHGNIGTADATFGGVSYWTDDQIQAMLDRTQVRRFLRDLVYLDDSGTDYVIPSSSAWLERAGSASGWQVYNASGSAIGTASYSVNYDANIITFPTVQSGAGYTLDYREYRLYEVVADVWEQKAGAVANQVNWQSDNHRVEASKKADQCLMMARKYRAMAGGGGVVTARRVRVDEARFNSSDWADGVPDNDED
jgi:hypothetical protein